MKWLVGLLTAYFMNVIVMIVVYLYMQNIYKVQLKILLKKIYQYHTVYIYMTMYVYSPSCFL